MSSSSDPELPPLLQGFFTNRLRRQRQASPHTVAAYRDTFRLLLRFASSRVGREPVALSVEDIDAPLVGAFLDHLENERGNKPSTRNARLAAIHSFFRYLAREDPGHGAVAQRVLAIPPKRVRRRVIDFLAEHEVQALLAVPDLETWTGRRDHALLLVAVQTGLRVSELLALRAQDVILGTGAHVRCHGKGRKDRCTPLRRDIVRVIRSWMREQCREPGDRLFPNARGAPMSRDGVAYLLAKHVRVARRACPSMRRKRVTPHVLRHTAAMALLHAGVGRSVIALWLGHESAETTDMYLHADLSMKERALSRTTPVGDRQARYQPGDRLLEFLDGL